MPKRETLENLIQMHGVLIGLAKSHLEALKAIRGYEEARTTLLNRLAAAQNAVALLNARPKTKKPVV
jgi:hypothetical protein